MNMIKALDTILRLGGIVYIFCIFIGLVITFIQIKFPAVEKMLEKFFKIKQVNFDSKCFLMGSIGSNVHSNGCISLKFSNREWF